MLFWSSRLPCTALLVTVVAAVLFKSQMLPLTVLPIIVTGAELYSASRLPLIVLPAHAVADPICAAAPLCSNCRLPLTTLPANLVRASAARSVLDLQIAPDRRTGTYADPAASDIHVSADVGSRDDEKSSIYLDISGDGTVSEDTGLPDRHR